MQDVFKAMDDIQHRMATTCLELRLLDLIVDCTRLVSVYGADIVKQEHIQWLQYHSGRLVYALHALRYKKLESLAWSTVIQLVVSFNSGLQWGTSQEYSFFVSSQ